MARLVGRRAQGVTVPAALAHRWERILTTGTWLWGDGSLQSITDVIKTGVPKPKRHLGAMPPLGGVALSDNDVAALAAYVWAIGHKTKG